LVQDKRNDVARDRRLGNLATPKSVQKLQSALHAKAKTEVGCRFYALYDKIYREDILAHAYAQCRTNKGAPRIDGQDFVDIEKYGVERWLGELALALREETYRPDPIRRVYIPKANGKLRPLGISTMSGMWRRSYGPGTWAPPDERGGNRQPGPTVTAPHLDSTRPTNRSGRLPPLRVLRPEGVLSATTRHLSPL